jgi:ferredoxin-NADP reductase
MLPKMAGWGATRATVARRLFLDRQAAFWRQELWDRRTRLVDVIVETRDTKTFVVRPPTGWRGHRAGQHTTIEVEVDGVRLRRCYSISSGPADRLIAFTVKRLPGGRLSGWLHDRMRAGDRIGLSPAAGDFVLPTPTPERLLLLSGGSGITPLRSMLRELQCRHAMHDVVLVHHARSREDIIFRSELESLAASHRGLRIIWCLSGEPSGSGRFDEQRFATLVPDFATRTTFLCGPAGLMARVERMWHVAAPSARLHRERFTGPAPAPVQSETDARVHVRLTRSRRSIVANTSTTLLEQLEKAGVQPPHGCRMGICHTCQSRKHTGTVRNLMTGALSSDSEEDVQLCISTPCSDVELSL